MQADHMLTVADQERIARTLRAIVAHKERVSQQYCWCGERFTPHETNEKHCESCRKYNDSNLDRDIEPIDFIIHPADRPQPPMNNEDTFDDVVIEGGDFDIEVVETPFVTLRPAQSVAAA